MEDLAVDRIILKWMRCVLNSWDSEYRQVVGPSGSGNKTIGGLLDCHGLLSFSRRTLFHVVSKNFTVQMIFCGIDSDTSESTYTANWKLSRQPSCLNTRVAFCLAGILYVSPVVMAYARKLHPELYKNNKS